MGSLGVKIQIKMKTFPTKQSGLAQSRLSQSCTRALSLSRVVVVCSRDALVFTMSKCSAPSTPGSSEKKRKKVLTLAEKMDVIGMITYLLWLLWMISSVIGTVEVGLHWFQDPQLLSSV